MLGDHVRLDAYFKAIQNQVKPGMVVAEIGTGTGILSAYAASRTTAPIFGIEYFENTAQMAEDMMKAAGLTQVKILRGESYDITLDPQPEVLVTETIGALGPEENIVELCYDFKKRHPKLTTLIPSRLRICAEPIQSKQILDSEQVFYDYFSSASFGTFNFQAIHAELRNTWMSRVRFDSLKGAKTIGECSVVVDYALGETEFSAFSTEIDLSAAKDADAVHLYFETKLDQDVLLSTHHSKPETHWRHAYVCKPQECNRLTISYSSESPALQAHWKS